MDLCSLMIRRWTNIPIALWEGRSRFRVMFPVGKEWSKMVLVASDNDRWSLASLSGPADISGWSTGSCGRSSGPECLSDLTFLERFKDIWSFKWSLNILLITCWSSCDTTTLPHMTWWWGYMNENTHLTNTIQYIEIQSKYKTVELSEEKLWEVTNGYFITLTTQPP